MNLKLTETSTLATVLRASRWTQMNYSPKSVQWNEMKYSSRRTIWYATRPKPSRGCRDTMRWNMQKLSETWRKTTSPDLGFIGMWTSSTPATSATVPRIWIWTIWLTFSLLTLIILHTSSAHNSATGSPIRACSISKCWSRRVLNFISLHHVHLSSSWCPKWCWKSARFC